MSDQRPVEPAQVASDLTQEVESLLAQVEEAREQVEKALTTTPKSDVGEDDFSDLIQAIDALASGGETLQESSPDTQADDATEIEHSVPASAVDEQPREEAAVVDDASVAEPLVEESVVEEQSGEVTGDPIVDPIEQAQPESEAGADQLTTFDDIAAAIEGAPGNQNGVDETQEVTEPVLAAHSEQEPDHVPETIEALDEQLAAAGDEQLANATAEAGEPQREIESQGAASAPAGDAIAQAAPAASAPSTEPDSIAAPSKLAQSRAIAEKVLHEAHDVAQRTQRGLAPIAARVAPPLTKALLAANAPLLKKPKSVQRAAGLIAIHTLVLGAGLWLYALVLRSPQEAGAVSAFDFSRSGLPQPDQEPGHDAHGDAHAAKPKDAGKDAGGGGHGAEAKDGKPAKPLLAGDNKFVLNDEIKGRASGKKEAAKSGGGGH